MARVAVRRECRTLVDFELRCTEQGFVCLAGEVSATMDAAELKILVQCLVRFWRVGLISATLIGIVRSGYRG